jgi:hypothetical protein
MFGELGFGALITLFLVFVFFGLPDSSRIRTRGGVPTRALLEGQRAGIDSTNSNGAKNGSSGLTHRGARCADTGWITRDNVSVKVNAVPLLLRTKCDQLRASRLRAHIQMWGV